MTVVTLVPTGARPVDTYPIAPRLDGLNGKRLGLLHNVKTNARELICEIGGLVQGRYAVSVVGPVLTQGQSGMLAKPEQLQKLAQEVDFVITAVGD